MGWQLVLRYSDGGVSTDIEVCDIGEVGAPFRLSELGINRDLSKKILRSLQACTCALQEEELARRARVYARATPCCEIKDYRKRSVQTLFGNVTIRIPRLRMRGRTIPFVGWPSHARATPDFDFIRIKCCAWMSYPKAMKLLGEVCPVEGGVTIGAAYEKVKKFAWSVTPDRTRKTGSSKEIFLPIDTTFVKGLPEQSDTSLEIMVGAAEATRGKQTYFSAPMTMHAHCLRLGHESLDKTGRTDKSTVVSFTDAGGNVQRLARELGATDLPITDWFHISMRIRHVEAIADAIRTPNRSFEASKGSIIRKIARLRLRLWRGKPYAIAKARRDLAPLLRTYRGDENPKVWKSQGKKLLAAITKLEAYINNPKTRLIDYCARQQSGKRVSTSLVEGGADFIVNARMGRQQHMRWSTRGAFQILQARTADINGTLEEKLLAAYPPNFRKVPLRYENPNILQLRYDNADRKADICSTTEQPIG